MTTPYYDADGITLYLGDCRDVDEWRAADVLVTDPPYGIAWRLHGDGPARLPGRRVDRRRHAGIVNDDDTSCRDYVLGVFGARPGVVFGAWAAPFPEFRQVLVWRKPADAGVIGSVTGYRRDTELIFLTGEWPRLDAARSSVLVTNSGRNAYLWPAQHPHGKPVGLMEALLAAAPPGVVADPFAGSGSTLVAAKLQGRRAVGVELEERYCEIAATRLAQGVLVFDGTL